MLILQNRGYFFIHEVMNIDDVTYFFLPRNFIMSSSGKNNILLQDVTQRRKNKLQSDGFAV